MDRKIKEGILGVEEEVYKRTSASNTRFRFRFKKMRMKVDASDYAIGEVLSIEYNNRRWRPVMFLLKSLNETEKNYKIHDKKMLAVIKGIGKLEALVRRCQVQV